MVEKIKYDLKNKKLPARLWTRWADYFDLRIMTGKVFLDIFFLFFFIVKKLYKFYSWIAMSLYKSRTFQFIRSITPFAISDALFIFGKYLYVFLFLFVLAFSSVFILSHFLQTSAFLFFITLLPLHIFIMFSIAVTYFFIAKKEKGEHITLFESFQACLQQFISISLLSLFHLFFTLTLIICFFMFGVFLGTFFDILTIDWRDSFMYWFIVICFGIIMTVIIFLFQTISYQAFFFAILEKSNPVKAFLLSRTLLKKHLIKFILYYFIFSACYLPFLYFAYVSFSDVAFSLLVLFYSQTVFFFSFLLRRAFLNKNTLPTTQSLHIEMRPTSTAGFAILFFVGLMSYILSAWFTVKIYPTLLQALKQQYEEAIILQNLTTYHNTEYSYTIAYPRSWTLYTQETNPITFAGNDTRTDIGALTASITVYPIQESSFQEFSESKPGLLFYDQDTKDVITKISNMKIQGFDTVKYTYIENGQPFASYQTHYLVNKQNIIYDIAFTTRTKEAEKENEKLFEKMIQSFQFVE